MIFLRINKEITLKFTPYIYFSYTIYVRYMYDVESYIYRIYIVHISYIYRTYSIETTDKRRTKGG